MSKVVSNLAEILKEAENTWNGILARFDLSWLPALLEALEPVAAVLTYDEVRTSSELGDSEERLLTEHPLYMAIAKRVEHGPRQLRNYRKLQAHYFFAHLKARERPKPLPNAGDDDSKFDPYKASLAVRSLSGTDWGHKRVVPEILVNLPLELPLEDFAESARIELRLKPGDQGYTRWSDDRVEYIAVFLEQVYGKPGRRIRNAHVRTVSSDTGDTDDPCYDFGRVSHWDSDGGDGDGGGNNSKGGAGGGASGGGGANNGSHGQISKDARDRLSYDDCPDEDAEDEGFGWSDDDEVFENSPGSFEAAMAAHSNQLIREISCFRSDIVLSFRLSS